MVWIDVVDDVSDCLYDISLVADKKIIVSIIRITEELVNLTAVIIILIHFYGNLITVGVTAIVNTFIFYFFLIVFIFSKSWMKPFTKGMFGSLASKVSTGVFTH